MSCFNKLKPKQGIADVLANYQQYWFDNFVKFAEKIKGPHPYGENEMTENKKKLRQRLDLRQVFEQHITADKRFGSCRASPKLPTLRFGNFVYPQPLGYIAKFKRRI